MPCLVLCPELGKAFFAFEQKNISLNRYGNILRTYQYDAFGNDASAGAGANGYDDAHTLTWKLGGPDLRRGPTVELSRGGAPGFFMHYHPRQRSNAHIWFPSP